MSINLHDLAVLSSGKSANYPLSSKVVWCQSDFGKEENLLLLLGLEPLLVGFPTCSLITILTGHFSLQ
jgi:hypothetical protein